MEEIDFLTLIETIQACRTALGVTDNDDEMCRNLGVRRTPEKRASLRRIADRCVKAGIAPLKANY